MTILNKIEQLEKHAWHGRQYAKLSLSEKQFLHDFLVQNAQLNTNDFEHKINRLFLNAEKPKNHLLIVELLSVANKLE